ncbi:MAG: 50S ribosomal protein L16 [Patescibacteria group bacterium]
MLQPAKTKYRKSHRLRGSFRGKSRSCTTLHFGTIGLKTLEAAELSSRQIEAARRAMAHSLKRGGKIWIRVFPDKPITRKAAEVPMGSGKGSVEFYVARIKPGHILFELDGLGEDAARSALRLAAYKLPVKTKIVTRLRHV